MVFTGRTGHEVALGDSDQRPADTRVTCASPADDDQPHHEQTEPPDQTHPIDCRGLLRRGHIDASLPTLIALAFPK